MIRVTLTTLIVGHIVWWPVWFVLMSFHGQDGFFIAGIIALAVGFGGTYKWLEALAENDSTHYWSEYEIIWQGGLLLLPAITAGTLGWVRSL